MLTYQTPTTPSNEQNDIFRETEKIFHLEISLRKVRKERVLVTMVWEFLGCGEVSLQGGVGCVIEY